MSPFVAAAAVALQENPAVNAVIDDGHIVYRDYVDISIAVSSPTGLVVPVLRGAEKMSFADIEQEIVRLGTKAKEGQLTVEDMVGGTFSITNGGAAWSRQGHAAAAHAATPPLQRPARFAQGYPRAREERPRRVHAKGRLRGCSAPPPLEWPASALQVGPAGSPEPNPNLNPNPAGGVFGSLMSTPIINPPQSAILGMHGIFPRPIAVKGQVVIRPMMYIAMTYDHRLIDGREAVTTLKRIKELCEDPKRFMLGC